MPIGAVVTAATRVKKQSRGQGLFLVSVKRSRTIFKLGNSGQDVYVLHAFILHIVYSSVCGQTVKFPFAVWSSGQATKTMVKIF